jgi:predicted transcriptional regulator
MQTTNQILDAIKIKHGLTSDYQLARLMGTSEGGISNYRNGRSHLDNQKAMKAAELLGQDAGAIFALVNAERAKTEQERAVWAEIFEKLGGIAASVLLAIGAATLPAPNAYAGAVSGAATDSTMYIMLNGKRRKKKRPGLLAALSL